MVRKGVREIFEMGAHVELEGVDGIYEGTDIQFGQHYWLKAIRCESNARKHFEKASADEVDYCFTTVEAGLRVNAKWTDGQEVAG